MPKDAQAPATQRREELLAIAARLFAEKGFKNTTVRDIADAAGILSGSLYHHFDSKESMVDEILRTFQEELFGQYDAILASDADPRAKLEQAVRVSFDAIDQHHDEVAIFQNDAAYLLHLRPVRLPRRAQRAVARRVADAAARRVSTRACCATTSTSSSPTGSSATPSGSPSRWYRPGGRRTHTEIADQYLSILLEGIHS